MEGKRKQIRLMHFDYSQPGAYFLTICAEHRKHYFGEVLQGEMQLNPAGNLAEKEIYRAAEAATFIVDSAVVMPNHVHCVIFKYFDSNSSEPLQARYGTAAGSVARFVQLYKSGVTASYSQRVKSEGWQPYAGRLFQRNYWEHVVRSEEALEKIREYIANNPLKWHLDRENKERSGLDSFYQWLKSQGELPV
jgi:putative transposase